MAKHTPGPWIVETDPCHFDTASNIVAGESDGKKFPQRQMMMSVGGFSGPEEQEANTRLAAASPDLLAALALCAAWLERYRPLEANEKSDSAREAIHAARAAIAKAEGRA